MAGLDVFACGSLPRELHWCPHGEELTVAATSQGCELHFVWAHQLSCFLVTPGLALRSRCGSGTTRAPRCHSRLALAARRARHVVLLVDLVEEAPGCSNLIERKVFGDLLPCWFKQVGGAGRPAHVFREVRQLSVLLLYWCAYARPHRVGRLRLRHGPTRSELYVEALACMVVPRWHALGPRPRQARGRAPHRRCVAGRAFWVFPFHARRP